MRKIAIILITIMLFMVAGCSNKDVIKHNYTYKGENEFWTVQYKVNSIDTFTKKDDKLHYEGNSNDTFTVTYKKNISDLSSVKHLQISYKSSAGGGSIGQNSPRKRTYTMTSSSTGGATEDKDEVIKVTINLDGKIQTIELKN
ncbi:hypothetical protein CLRAG_08860 [Clostridium ragsdalei P11]|uniref:Lipoprotein n=1 Tax=Clostridium ragsdalei P11 TaxID=1353534 RepID=A0A1A6AZJ1_9CLOT|nr:hypothetical protein [Clostridium ragsdalei]OBR95494.1 hypothetical protein CLRAG_08860 [Clostridium ragsdalei P11]